METKLCAPITYQGGKQRIASLILNHLNWQPNQRFYDLCCGSGALSVEIINKGHPVDKITMVDKSPWGLFWQMVGLGTFDINKFANYCDAIPKDRSEIKSHMQKLFNEPINADGVYIFLLLQASTFGGAAVWNRNNKWKKSGGFRNYWMPTETSNRRSPVNPMMPLPETLIERVNLVCCKMKGVQGIYADIKTIIPESDSIVYIDPPYNGTAVYGYSFDVVEYAKSVKAKCFVSEGKSLSSTAYLISGGRKKGGMSGERISSPNEEWLSEFQNQ